MEDAGGRGSNHRGSRPQEGVGVQPGRKLLSWGSFETGRLPDPVRPAQAVSPVPSSDGNREEVDFSRRIRALGWEKTKSYWSRSCRQGTQDALHWIRIPPLPLTSSVALGQLFNLSEPQVPNLLGFLGGLNEIIYVNDLVEIADA